MKKENIINYMYISALIILIFVVAISTFYLIITANDLPNNIGFVSLLISTGVIGLMYLAYKLSD